MRGSELSTPTGSLRYSHQPSLPELPPSIGLQICQKCRRQSWGGGGGRIVVVILHITYHS